VGGGKGNDFGGVQLGKGATTGCRREHGGGRGASGEGVWMRKMRWVRP
jgi:hypothetical protein